MTIIEHVTRAFTTIMRVYLIGAGCGVPLAAAAQGPDPDTTRVRGAAFARAIDRLEAGSLMQVSIRGHRSIIRFQGVTRDSIIGTSDYGRRAASRASVDSLWLGERATQRGAIVGALVGGVLLGSLGFAISKSTLDHQRCNCGQMIPLGAVSGAFLGAVIGALSGSGTYLWKRVYP